MLNELANELYTNAIDKGIYDKYYNLINAISDKNNTNIKKEEYGYADVLEICKQILLIHTELSEAVEALQKKNFINLSEWNNIDITKVEEDSRFEHIFSQVYKNRFEVELIDALFRLLTTMKFCNIDIDSLVKIVMRNNSLRDYKDKEFN